MGKNHNPPPNQGPMVSEYDKKFFGPPTENAINRFCDLLDDNFSELEQNMRERPPKNAKSKCEAIDKKLSTLFRSALALYKNHGTGNEDYVSQAAHSIREMFYEQKHFINYIKKPRGGFLLKEEQDRIIHVEGYFCDLAHHNKNGKKEFFLYYINELIMSIEESVKDNSGRPISTFYDGEDYYKIFEKINTYTNRDPEKGEDIIFLMNLVYSDDMNLYHYFYSNVKYSWIKLLEEKGYLSKKINSYNTKELDSRYGEITFLENASEEYPKDVANVLLNLKKSKDLSQLIVTSFLRISINLPKEMFYKLADKIIQEKWLEYCNYKGYGTYHHDSMLKKLKEYDSYGNLLKVANSMLTLKKSNEDAKSSSSYENEEDFEINMLDLRNGEVFGYLSERPNEEYRNKVLVMLINKVNQLIRIYSENITTGESEDEHPSFSYYDPLGFYGYGADISFIEEQTAIPMDTTRYDGMRYMLFMLNKILLDEMGRDPDQANSIYLKYLGAFSGRGNDVKDIKLIHSPATWRLRLHLLSIAPKSFEAENKDLLFYLFEAQVFGYAVKSEEYFLALQKCFPMLKESDKLEYINKLISFHGNYNDEDPAYIKQKVCDVSGMLEDYIKENPAVERKFKENSIIPNYDYKPKPNDAHKVISTWSDDLIRPITDEEFAEISVVDIAKKLREEWSAVGFFQTKTGHSVNECIYGVNKALIADISTRPDKYCQNAERFFEIDIVDPSYTRSYFDGMEQVLKNEELQLLSDSLTPVFRMCKSIVSIGNGKLLLKADNGMGYNSAIKSMIRFLQALITSSNQDMENYVQDNRNNIIEIIKLLLTSDDLSWEEEKNSRLDPFMTAVNSIRGMAYQLLVNFTCIDSNDSIAKDIKGVYKRSLENEETRALFFLFGRYLSSFYHRDKKWTGIQINKIFPQEETKKHLFSAAWEGMLSDERRLYILSRPKIQKVYLRGFDIISEGSSSQQNNFINPNQNLAGVIAAAYLNILDFDDNHPLYKRLWEKGDIRTQKYFVNYIGEVAFSNRMNNTFGKKRFNALWENILEDNAKDSQILRELGYSIELNNNFGPRWLAKMLYRTLKATHGQLSRYYKIREIIVELAKEAPKDTLEIIKLIMARKPYNDNEYYEIIGGTGKEWREAFHVIYNKTLQMKKGKEKHKSREYHKAVLGSLLKHHSLVFASLVGNLD